MNAALLKILRFRGGTPFCPVAPIGRLTHPNPSSAASFPVEATAPQTLQPSQWAALARFLTPKGPSFVPPKARPTNTSAIGGLFN